MPDDPSLTSPSVTPTIVCAGAQRQRDPNIFSGTNEKDIEDWLESYERDSNTNKWDDPLKLCNAIFYLSGVAKRYIDDIVDLCQHVNPTMVEADKNALRPITRKSCQSRRLGYASKAHLLASASAAVLVALCLAGAVCGGAVYPPPAPHYAPAPVLAAPRVYAAPAKALVAPVAAAPTFAMLALAAAASTRGALAKPGFDPHSPEVHAVHAGPFHTIVDGLSRPHLVEPRGTPVGISIVPLHDAGYAQQHAMAPVTVHVTQVGVHQAPVIGVSAAPVAAVGVREGPLALHASHPLLNAVASPGMVLHGAPVLAGPVYQPAVQSEPVGAALPVKQEHHEQLVPQPYSFGYEISDGYGNKQVRHEVSDGHNHKRGSYGFVDARGIYRQVHYVADHNGFRATIESNEPGVAAGYSAGAAFKVGQRRARPVVHRRPIPPPPHRVPVLVQRAPANNLVQKSVGIAAAFHAAVPAAVAGGVPAGVHTGVATPGRDPALQALQVVQALHGKALTALPVSSVQYSPGLEHSGGIDFIPSAPRLTAATTAGSSLVDPRRSHVTYVEAPQEHPFTNLRTSPPVNYEGGPGAQKQH
ncbi:uncharacterized protein [Dermacentor albipictus]|uniref:uncharacterized protein n=1 Tax=Dermacentor albipictus TaxID=60249 RepID=UPI0038FC6416